MPVGSVDFNLPIAVFGLPGGAEWVIIFAVVLLLFGGEKIPELMRGLGKGMGELQRGLEDGKRKLEEAMHEVEETSKTQS